MTTCQSARVTERHYQQRHQERLSEIGSPLFITVLQDAVNQKLGVVEYTYAKGLQPVEFIEETTSGKTPIKERQLQQVIDSMVQGDTLIVSELSRLGRNMEEVMSVLD